MIQRVGFQKVGKYAPRKTNKDTSSNREACIISLKLVERFLNEETLRTHVGVLHARIRQVTTFSL